MSVMITLYQLAGILAGLSVILGVFTKYLSMKMREEWHEELAKVKETVNNKFHSDIISIKTLVEKECSQENIKSKVKDFIDGKISFIEQDVRQIKELTIDLKQLLSTQQETLIAIQMSLTELKPRIASLEERVSKLERG